jgi:hypothetical protein
MEDVLYNLFARFSGFPSSNIDRKLVDVDPSAWPNRVANELANDVPPANIEVSVSYDEDTREISTTISAEFFQTLITEYRLSAMIVEDAVRGASSGYDQINAYANGNNGDMGDFDELPNPVPANKMIYDYVGRELLGGYSGSPNSLPATITPGETHEYTYTYILPEEYDPEYTHVVGVLVKSATGEVENAGRSAYVRGNSNAKPFFHTEPQMTADIGNTYTYDIHVHDPRNSDIDIYNATDLPSWLTLNDNGDGTATLSGSPQAPGVYEITLIGSDGEYDVAQDFFIVVDEPSDKDWEQLGDLVSDSKVLSPDIAINNQNLLFTAHVEDEAGKVRLHQYYLNNWSLVGSLVEANASEVALALPDFDLAYVAVASDQAPVKVYGFGGQVWDLIGDDIDVAGSNQLDLVYENETLYVAMRSANENAVRVYKFSGDGWVQLGSDFPITSSHPRLAFDSNGNTYVIYSKQNDTPVQNYVSMWDGQNWTDLGGASIDAEGTAGGHDIYIGKNDQVYVSYTSLHNIKPRAATFKNGAWEIIGSDLSEGNTFITRLVVDDNKRVIVSFEDQGEGGKISTMVFNGLTWKPLGTPGISNSQAGLGELLLSSQDVPIMSFIDNGDAQQMAVWTFGTFRPGVVSVFNQADALPLQVYPNPAINELVISSADQLMNGRLEVFSSDGRTMFNQEYTNTKKMVINCLEWSPGIYVIHFQSGNKTYLGKVIRK